MSRFIILCQKEELWGEVDVVVAKTDQVIKIGVQGQKVIPLRRIVETISEQVYKVQTDFIA